jgi:hypothetical protein
VTTESAHFDWLLIVGCFLDYTPQGFYGVTFTGWLGRSWVDSSFIDREKQSDQGLMQVAITLDIPVATMAGIGVIRVTVVGMAVTTALGDGVSLDPRFISRPVGHKHINFRGIYRFAIKRRSARLLASAA